MHKTTLRKLLATLVCGCVAVTAAGFAACGGTNGAPGKSAYDIAVENGFKGTEAEWLESLKGKSAYDIWLENGHTGTEEDFLNWLKGENGKDGEDGKDGKSAYEIWLEQGNTGSEADFLDWIRGKSTGTTISVEAGGTYDMPISDISAGVHIIEVDLNSTKLDTGRLQAKIGEEGALSEIVYSETRSTDGHNVYYGYINITEGATAITFSAIDEAVEGTAEIKDWEIPTLTVGTPIEIPVNIYQTADENLIKIKLDPSIEQGSYTVTVEGNPALNGTLNFYANTTRLARIGSTTSWPATSVTMSVTGEDVYLYLISASSTATLKQIQPVTITLTTQA